MPRFSLHFSVHGRAHFQIANETVARSEAEEGLLVSAWVSERKALIAIIGELVVCFAFSLTRVAALNLTKRLLMEEGWVRTVQFYINQCFVPGQRTHFLFVFL